MYATITQQERDSFETMSSSAQVKFLADALDRCLGDRMYDLYVKPALSENDPMVNDDDFCQVARTIWSLNDFTIVRELGRGGMGTVFQATHLESGYMVALKEVEIMEKSQSVYVKEEWDIHRSLNHPHIVKYYGGFVSFHQSEWEHLYPHPWYSYTETTYHSCQDSTGLETRFNGLNLNECSTTESSLPNFKKAIYGKHKSYRPRSLYFVLEYCTGGSLGAIINSPIWPLINSEQKVANYARGIMEACHYLHQQGIVHRDLKPDNILVAQDGSIKLADFGIAASCSTGDRLVTLIGTLPFMAPEMLTVQLKRSLRNSGYDRKVDSWSLGIVIHQLLTAGTHPYEQHCAQTFDQEILREQFFSRNRLPPIDFDETISKDAKRLIEALMKFNPSSRMSMEEALEHPWIRKNTTKSN